MRKLMRNDLQRELDSIQKRIDKMQLMSDFLKRNPQIAARSTVKYLSGAYVGLVVDDKALIRPQGLNSDALRLERWLEDIWDEVELGDRILSKDISGLSSDELDAILTEIPSPNGDEASEDEEDD